MLNLFLDANIWLDLYHFSNDDLKRFDKLADMIGRDIRLFVTSHLRDEVGRNRDAKIKDTYTKENVVQVVATSRGRWKIENEDINTLKTKGYHFEHNFGHAQGFLSQTLLSLNLLALLFHTVLELLEPCWRAIRRRCLAATPSFSIWQC